MMRKPALAALALVTSLAACSNDPGYVNPFTTTYGIIRGLITGPAPGAEITPEQILRTLASTELPTLFFSLPDRESQVLLVQIEENGPYRTYANPDRQAITLRSGMITGTRGLSGDLMSVDEGALLDLVRARGTGKAVYIQRWLTPEDVTQVATYRCDVEPDKPVDVALGLVQSAATEVIAACESPDAPAFVDYYVVSGEGEILASRQWLGPNIGYGVMHQLRR